MLEKVTRRVSQLTLLFLCPISLTACSSPQSWTLESQENSPESYSSQLLINPKDTFQHLGFEILKTPEGRKVYLFVKSKALKVNGKKKIPLKIQSAEGDKIIGLIPLKGGQKALMPFKSSKALLKGLEEGRNYSLSVQQYHTTLYGQQLSSPIKKLKEL